MKRAGSDQSEKTGGRAEREVGRCDARDLLRDIQGIGGCIQRENAIPSLQSLGFVCHGTNGESGAAWML